MRLPRHPYLDPARVEHDLAGAARRDPLGHRLHIVFGLLWCFSVGCPTSVVEIGGIPLMVFFALRTPNIWRTWGSFAVQPLVVLIAAWAAWQTLTLAWSPDVKQGVQELAANRWVWVIWMLWPVMERRGWFIAALAAGFLCGNLSQLTQGLGDHFGWSWVPWRRMPDRVSGWWDPVVGGSLLVGALGLHLPAALMGRGRLRWLAGAACLVQLGAIFATGTRGAWLAAAALVLVAIVVAATRGRPAGRLAATLALVLALGAAGAGLAWAAAGDSISRRAAEALREVDRAIRERDYNSDTGARVLMARAAAAAWREHPVAGVGAGGFRHAMGAYVRHEGLDPAQVRIHAHAHNALLQIAATTGTVGVILALGIIVAALRGAFSELGRTGLTSYAAGPGFALVGLLLVSAFDPVHLNAQTGALLGTLMAMSLVARRPRALSSSPPAAQHASPATPYASAP